MGDGIILQEEDLVFNNIPVHKEELDFRLTFKDWPSLKELEKIYIAKLFLEKDFSKEKIAQVLGVNRKTLYRKIKEYELEN
jgi:DNA-binding NtrC family response regulator